MTGSRWRTVDCGVSTDRQGQDHAAAKSPDPEAGISRAVNSVIWRISLFYVGSIFVIVALMPYDQLAEGSYQSTL